MARDAPGTNPIHSLEKVPSKKEDLVSFLGDVWTYVKAGRTQFDYRIQELRYFLAGEQWIRHNPTFNRFERHALDDWVPTPVTNFLAQHYDYLCEVFTAGDPYPEVDPATRDLVDVDAAKAARRVLQSEFLRLRSDARLIQPAVGWLVLCGNAVLASFWNARAGDRIARPRTELAERPMMQDAALCSSCGYSEPAIMGRERCPQCGGVLVAPEGEKMPAIGESGAPLSETFERPVLGERGEPVSDEYTVGNLEERVVNLLQFFPQPCADMADCRYVVEAQPMDLDALRDLFGTKASKQMAEALDIQEWDTSFAGVNSNAQMLNTREQKRDKVLVKFLRHIPDHRFKRGLLVIGTRDTLYYKGDLDSADDSLGYTHIRYREIPGVFWGVGPAGDILPQQKRINAIDSSIVQNRKQMVSPQWLVPDGSGLTHVDGRSGLVNRWNPSTSAGFKPERLPGVPLPQAVLAEKSGEIAAMMQVSGITEVMSGQLPTGSSGLETGAAVENLYEAAYKRFRNAGERWRSGLAHHFQRNLMLVAANWDEPRLVRVLGENKELETYSYAGADLTRAQDMIVRTTLGTRTSTVLHQRRIMDAAKAGLLGNLADPSVRGRVLEQLDIAGFEDEYVADARKARRVLRALRDGDEAPAILPTDNHVIQYEVIREFTLTTEFEQLDQERQQMILKRAMQHKQVAVQEQQQAMQAAVAAKGTDQRTSAAVAQSGAMGGAAVPQTAPAGR
jgi:hypothetical protein